MVNLHEDRGDVFIGTTVAQPAKCLAKKEVVIVDANSQEGIKQKSRHYLQAIIKEGALGIAVVRIDRNATREKESNV